MRKLPDSNQMRAYIARHDKVLSQGEYYYGRRVSFQTPYDKDLSDGIGELIEVFTRRYGYLYRVDIDVDKVFIAPGNIEETVLAVDIKTIRNNELAELYTVLVDFDFLVRDIDKFYRYFLGLYEVSV